MNKKLIRLTESDLHRIVRESVNKVLKEYNGMVGRTSDFYGKVKVKPKEKDEFDMLHDEYYRKERMKRPKLDPDIFVPHDDRFNRGETQWVEE